MKLNLPVTGQEKIYPTDYVLVSRTDTKGIITFANDMFVEVCGYSRQELVGTNHNIIRHPDMPPAAFETMWKTIKAGFPWLGLVKNRCTNGDHYWVKAHVVPVKKDGAIIGYMSVRSCPTREEVAAAEAAYKAAPKSLADTRTTVRELTGMGWKRMFSIKNGVSIGIGFVSLMMIVGGVLGIVGLRQSNQAIQSLYHADLAPLRAIGRINFLMAENRAQVALALHHDPFDPGSTGLGHDTDAHSHAIVRNKDEIDTLWSGYSRQITDKAERVLADTYWRARTRYVEEGLMAAKAAMERGDYARLNSVLLGRVNPLFEESNEKVAVLQRYLSERALGNYTALVQRNQQISSIAVAGIVLGAIILFVSGWYFFRMTILPLQKAVESLEKITEGNLSETVQASAYGETGRVMAAVTVMRTHLKVMMDEISQSSGAIHDQCHHLNQIMMNLSEHSEEQHDRIYQTLDALLESCAGLSALAANADALRNQIVGDTVSSQETPGSTVTDRDDAAPKDLAERADEVASAVSVLSFMVEEASAQLKQVATLIVENREAVQGAWSASQKLEKAALELDKLVKYFD